MNLYLKLRNNKVNGAARSRPDRGSTILLVLAMLTILLLLGIAFSYSTRLETQASTNYAKLTQARTSAATGLPMSLPFLLKASQGLTTPLQDWNTIPQYVQKIVKTNGKSNQLGTGEMAALNRAGLSIHQNRDGELESAPQANIVIRDLSGMVNINAVEDQAAMERVISAVLPGGDSRQKTNVLMALRGDLTRNARNNANRAGTDTDEEEPARILDVRDPSAVLLDSLDRLKFGANTGRSVFTDAEIEKLSANVTIYSQAPEVYNLPDGKTHLPRIPLDSLDAKQVYETLRQAFPGKQEELLLQFTANLIDYSDDDNEPTVLDSDGNVQSISGDLGSGAVIGVEMTPLISEVYPDAATSVGFSDDGQYVEIYNPWNKSISLSGWKLGVKSGGTVSLSATLPANGYLLITDNFNAPQGDTPPGHGSVVSIFGATANGGTKQYMIHPSLDLTDRNSEVSLYDADGNLVDVFKYGTSGTVDGKKSFQRKDPTVRGSIVAEGTPLQAASGMGVNGEVTAAQTKAWEDGNTTITKISQLFAISTGFAENSASGGIGSATGTVYANQLAELTVPEGASENRNSDTDPLPNNLDLRLVDVFTATPRYVVQADSELDEDDPANGRDAYNAFRRKMERLREQSDERFGNDSDDEETSNGVVYSYGKLNLNTCNKYALLGLNLNASVTKGDTPSMIEQFEGHRLMSVQQGNAPFNNVSDFISDFVGSVSRSNLTVLDDVTNQVTVGSSSFEIISTNRLSPEEQAALDGGNNASGPRPATSTVKWIISLDQEPYSVVSFTTIP